MRCPNLDVVYILTSITTLPLCAVVEAGGLGSDCSQTIDGFKTAGDPAPKGDFFPVFLSLSFCPLRLMACIVAASPHTHLAVKTRTANVTASSALSREQQQTSRRRVLVRARVRVVKAKSWTGRAGHNGGRMSCGGGARVIGVNCRRAGHFPWRTRKSSPRHRPLLTTAARTAKSVSPRPRFGKATALLRAFLSGCYLGGGPSRKGGGDRN